MLSGVRTTPDGEICIYMLPRAKDYVRPILIMLDKPDPERLTNRKLALEIEKFNVLTAYSLDELFATCDKLRGFR